jgi:hypothetical protein
MVSHWRERAGVRVSFSTSAAPRGSFGMTAETFFNTLLGPRLLLDSCEDRFGSKEDRNEAAPRRLLRAEAPGPDL